jgi:hypothetical protein
MAYREWSSIVDELEPHIVRISTPKANGTGFLIARLQESGLCAVATAAHVVSKAHWWEQPIRLTHPLAQKTVLLREPDRAIFIDEDSDTAVVIFAADALPLPDQAQPVAPKNTPLKVGHEVGWLGYPGVDPQRGLCFFSGRISAVRSGGQKYLVDGVAIDGVSGGPVFWNGEDAITLIGVMSAYLPNRAAEETLPGLSVVQDVTRCRDLFQNLGSFEEAKQKESDPQQPFAPPTRADSA